MTPTTPPLPVRLWRSIWRTPLAYRWLALACVALVAVGWVAMTWDIATDGGDHRPPSYQVPLTAEVHLCPSVQGSTAPARLEAARERAQAHGCPGPLLLEDACEGPPGPTVVQVRGWRDVVVDQVDGRGVYLRGLQDEYTGHVSWHPLLPGTGVLHWMDGRTHADGEWLHIAGVGNERPDGSDGHSTRATSAASSTHEGTSWADVDCDGGAP